MKVFFIRCGFAIALLLGCTSPGFSQETTKHAITFDDMMKLHRIAEPQVSRDGKWVAYTVFTPDMDANRSASNIWVVPTAGGAAMQLTQSGHDSSPVTATLLDVLVRKLDLDPPWYGDRMLANARH